VGLVWNEISRRYVDYEPEFYYPEYWRGRPDNKKQGSSEEEIDINPSSGSGPAMVDDYEQAIQRCSWTYNELLRKGVAPEMARMVLPQSMFTEWYWTGSLVSFARVCSLRIKVDAQEETRDIASLIEVECANCFPTSWEALTQLP
jgi:thymidylate synthase (FAD)